MRNNYSGNEFGSAANGVKQETGLNSVNGGGGGSNANNNNNEYGNNTNPLAHLSDSVNSLDPLNAMEKSLNDQVSSIHLPSHPNGYLTHALCPPPIAYRCRTHRIRRTRPAVHPAATR